ncbi:MAG: hypothetical protein QNJ22_05625 [Desulfosarcinaceae bacterium]|nr:hypothetical protein [Desulfosarcinaceae bacterium]
MLIWAARDLARHPWRHLATALTLFALALLLGGTQLVRLAFVETSAHLLAKAPAIVIRRAAPTGWVPIPITAAERAAAKVPGALTPHPRLWGLARIAGQTVVVMASPPAAEPARGRKGPAPGTVITGNGVAAVKTGDRLVFDGHPQRSLAVVGQLPAETAAAAHDLVLMHPDDARALLDIPPGHASDLAIEVFHETAIEALANDLAGAFPWPVQIRHRTTEVGRTLAGWERRATLATMIYAPALLALVALGLTSAVSSERASAQSGLLRALGWTGRDFMRLHLWRWAVVCLPSVGLGLASAYLVAFAPGVRWPGPLLFGWTATPPPFYLSAAGSAAVLLQAAALVALPYLAIVVLTGLRHSSSDPHMLMEEGLR